MPADPIEPTDPIDPTDLDKPDDSHEAAADPRPIQIWVDADACPVAVKEILFRAARRTGIVVTLVANQMLAVPPSPYIRARQVPSGFDVADRHIIEAVQAGDLVITADVPLAAKVIANGATVIEPRGDLLDDRNIDERLSMRDFLDELRGSGMVTGGPPAYADSDRRAFANRLDRWLATRAKQVGR